MSRMFIWSRSGVPEHTQEALENYFVRGYEPGSFLTATLAGDLMAAACKADSENTEALAYIAKWIVNNAPVGSWGSYDTVRSWCRGNEYRTAFEKQCVVNILSEQY